MAVDMDEYVYVDENASLELCIQSIIGNRKEQQDFSGYRLGRENGLIVVCDGMGGHAGGQQASRLATKIYLDEYEKDKGFNSPVESLVFSSNKADDAIFDLRGSNGIRMSAGSTAVAVYVEKKMMHWSSVGDSRIYIQRDKELVLVTKSHNYKMILDEQLEKKQILQEEYSRKLIDGEKLISYLGMGGLKMIDINNQPFKAIKNDRILLTTDGLFKILSDDEIRIILSNFTDIKEAARALIMKAKRSGNGNLDNITIAILKIK